MSFELTNEIIQWCKEQHYAFSNEWLGGIVIGLITLILGKIMINYNYILAPMTETTPHLVEKIGRFVEQLGIIILVLTLLYVAFFIKP